MSQLESILGQLNKSLAESGVDASKFRKEDAVQTVDPKSASAALKDFLSKNPITSKKGSDDGDDPALVLERRKTLSAFVGQSLSNNGVACLPGTIQAPAPGSAAGGHGHGHGGRAGADKPAQPATAAPPPVPFTPAPMPVMQICPSCVTAEASKKAPKAEEKPELPKVEPASQAKPTATSSPASSAPMGATSSGSGVSSGAASSPPWTAATLQASSPVSSAASLSAAPNAPASTHSLSTPTPPAPASAAASGMAAPQGMSFSTPQLNSAPASSEPSASSMPPAKADSNSAKPQSKGGVAGFFASLMPGKKGANQEAEPETPTASASGSVSKITWFKHIQAIESALLIGDVHFADSLLQLLYETAKSLSAEVNIIARLQSLQAKVLIEKRQFDDAESSLKDMIQSLQGSSFAKNICTAYCWRALALCYHRQKKTAEAEAARKKSIEVAEAALGPTNPETMLFKEPIV